MSTACCGMNPAFGTESRTMEKKLGAQRHLSRTPPSANTDLVCIRNTKPVRNLCTLTMHLGYTVSNKPAIQPPKTQHARNAMPRIVLNL